MKFPDIASLTKAAFMLLAFAATSCKDAYDLPVNIPASGYLVVDGVVNSGQGPTTISLSKTVRLIDSFNINYITDAAVVVEGEDNSRFPLMHTGRGQYTNSQLALNRSQKYRLSIRLADGKEYKSGFLPVNATPAIESVNWVQDGAGVHIYVDAKGNANTSGYYRWEYEEDWEFNAAYAPNLRYVTGPRVDYIFQGGGADMSKFTCYQSAKSSTIEILSTARLNRDTTHYRITTVPRASWKISVLYSILAKQFAISREGYEYLSRMKKNTEQTGSIFDSQPSELVGNVKNINDPGEPVIGFVEISEVHTKRIFIKRSEVPDWGYIHGCDQRSIPNHPDSIMATGMAPPVAPDVISPVTSAIIRYFITEPVCVDCTLRGVLDKPSFWP
jgi:hypothetical protein